MARLKKAIRDKKMQEFQYIDTDTLVLWRVSISDLSGLEKLSDDDFANVQPLSPIDRLSTVFSSVAKERHLHIIVKPPTIGKCP